MGRGLFDEQLVDGGLLGGGCEPAGTLGFIWDALKAQIAAEAAGFLADQFGWDGLAIDEIRHRLAGDVDEDRDAAGEIGEHEVGDAGGR